MHTHQLIIVGAGPAGLACSLAAARTALDHIVLERGAVAHTIDRYPTDLVFFSSPEKLTIGGVPFDCPDPRPTRRQVVAYYRGVAQGAALPIHSGCAVTAARRTPDGFALSVTRGTAELCYRCRNLVVATGCFDAPRRLGVPGEELAKCTPYLRDAEPYAGRRVAVVGGGNSAAEAALALQRAGARVTLIHRGPELRASVKPWVRPQVEEAIARGAIEARFAATVTRIEPTLLVLAGPRGEEPLANDAVLIQIGYRPHDRLLRELGVAIDPATLVPAFDRATFETAIPGLFVCGVLTAGDASGVVFIENGRHHGDAIVATIANRLKRAGTAG